LPYRGVHCAHFLGNAWSEPLKRDSFMLHTLRNRKRAGIVRSGVSQKRDVGPRPPFIRISQARSGTLIQISRPCGLENQSVMHTFVSTWGSRPRIFGYAKFPYLCATSGCRPSEWTKGTPCLASRGPHDHSDFPCPTSITRQALQNRKTWARMALDGADFTSDS
jgi:hypothetical protein